MKVNYHIVAIYQRLIKNNFDVVNERKCIYFYNSVIECVVKRCQNIFITSKKKTCLGVLRYRGDMKCQLQVLPFKHLPFMTGWLLSINRCAIRLGMPHSLNIQGFLLAQLTVKPSKFIPLPLYHMIKSILG